MTPSKTYQGRPCSHGHPGIRFISDDCCADCKRATNERRRDAHKIARAEALAEQSDRRERDQAMAATALARIRRRRGLVAKIADMLILNHQTITNWKMVPLDHVFAVSRICTMPPEDLRPDFFRNDPLRRSAFTKSLHAPAKVLRPNTGATPCTPTSPAAANVTDRFSAPTTAVISKPPIPSHSSA